MAKCFQCLRVLVIIFNVLFVLIGCAILGLSIFMFVNQEVKTMKESAGEYSTTFDIILFAGMGIGAITVIVGTFGCCGAYHDSECLLGTYFFFILVILCAEVAAGVVMFIFKDKEPVEKVLQVSLKSAIDKYMDDKNKDTKLPPHLSYIQNYFKCCGASGPQDYMPKATWSMLKDSEKFKNACKHLDFFFKTVQGKEKFNDYGCVSKAQQWLKDNAVYVLIGCCAVAGLELIAMIVAICLCCAVRRMDAGYVGVST